MGMINSRFFGLVFLVAHQSARPAARTAWPVRPLIGLRGAYSGFPSRNRCERFSARRCDWIGFLTFRCPPVSSDGEILAGAPYPEKVVGAHGGDPQGVLVSVRKERGA